MSIRIGLVLASVLLVGCGMSKKDDGSAGVDGLRSRVEAIAEVNAAAGAGLLAIVSELEEQLNGGQLEAASETIKQFATTVFELPREEPRFVDALLSAMDEVVKIQIAYDIPGTTPHPNSCCDGTCKAGGTKTCYTIDGQSGCLGQSC